MPCLRENGMRERLPKLYRRKIGRLVREGKLPAQRYRVLLFNQENGLMFLCSQNATTVAYVGKSAK